MKYTKSIFKTLLWNESKNGSNKLDIIIFPELSDNDAAPLWMNVLLIAAFWKANMKIFLLRTLDWNAQATYISVWLMNAPKLTCKQNTEEITQFTPGFTSEGAESA